MSWLAALPYVFQVIGWILTRAKASKETQQAFLNLIEKCKDDPAISLRLKKDFKDMEAELKAGGGQ